MKRILFICFIFISAILNAQEKRIVWDYPIKPGSEAWRETSYSEKIEKSQPTKELLNNWSTEILLKYCIDYPFNKVTLLYNNPNDGFQRVYEQSSVWQEFIRRKDAFDVFVGCFSAHTYERLLDENDIETRNEKLFNMFFLEKVVSETDFVHKLSLSEKIKLADIILKSHQSKKDFPDVFLGFNYNSSLSAILTILDDDDVVSKDGVSLKSFREKTNNEYFTDDSMESVIMAKVMNYINKKR